MSKDEVKLKCQKCGREFRTTIVWEEDGKVICHNCFARYCQKQIAELKAEIEKLKKLKFLSGTNCTLDEFIKWAIKDEEISNAKALEQINIDNEILHKQLKEKDAEIERLNGLLDDKEYSDNLYTIEQLINANEQLKQSQNQRAVEVLKSLKEDLLNEKEEVEVLIDPYAEEYETLCAISKGLSNVLDKIDQLKKELNDAS